jgi:hypothetical protein
MVPPQVGGTQGLEPKTLHSAWRSAQAPRRDWTLAKILQGMQVASSALHGVRASPYTTRTQLYQQGPLARAGLPKGVQCTGPCSILPTHNHNSQILIRWHTPPPPPPPRAQPKKKPPAPTNSIQPLPWPVPHRCCWVTCATAEGLPRPPASTIC